MSSDTEEKTGAKSHEPAANLARGQIEDLYKEYSSESQGQLTERFWQAHHNHPNPHSAWQEYYHNLGEDEKHQLWEEYHEKAPVTPEPAQAVETEKPVTRTEKRRHRATKRGPFQTFLFHHVWPIVSAALVVSVLWLVFNNELIIARVKQYVSPGNTSLSPTIIDPSTKVGKDSKLIIPKISVEIPVIYSIKTYDEDTIQAGLERGAVHYGSTALPGQIGNNVIVGHSASNFFNRGDYKYAFVLLNHLEKNDTFILHYKGTRYVYKVTKKQIVQPNDFSLIQPTSKPVTTLITCYPTGTSKQRLVIQGTQVSPNPSKAKKGSKPEITNENAGRLPSNADSLWSKFINFLF